ncbi:MAG TPA: acyl-CoA dehydrogenase family protein, partial [Nakamurella sp.]|nr:acyl-CoA dehydrogenase family protein [Nakamurella sp.]
MNQFALTPPQRELMDRARGVAEEVLLPLAEAGQPGRINRPLVAALGEHGLLGRVFPGVAEKSAAADAGSRQVAALDLCLLRESIAQCCPEA